MKHLALVLVTLIAVTTLAPCQSLALLSHEVRDTYETTVLQGPGDIIITLISHGALTSEQTAWLTTLYDLGAQQQTVSIRSVRVLIEGNEAEITVLPTQFSRDGYDLTNFLPSGIQLYYDEDLEYDFRVLVGHYFLRLRGQFVSDTDLAIAILAAIEAPADYLNAETSRHFNDRFTNLRTEIETLRDSDVQQSKSITRLEEDLGSLQHTDSSVDTARLATLESSVAKLSGTVVDLRGEISARQTDIADLQKLYQTLADTDQGEEPNPLEGITKKYETLRTDLGRTRTALIALNNRRARPVDSVIVDRIVELKKANPALTQTDVSRQLKSEGLSASTREISLVFSVYFAEF